MATKALYDQISAKLNKEITRQYSTSFSMGIKMLHPSIREGIYAIYGFVRLADEIVDTFHEYEQEQLLHEFIEDTRKAIDRQISMNPVLNNFQKAVNAYSIEWSLIQCFFDSMETDLNKNAHNQQSYDQYILGSAQVVGLMCLRVFCKGNLDQYEHFKEGAMSLGAAFQKVNFLRDIKADNEELGRIYFPNLTSGILDEAAKIEIEKDIQKDFDHALENIRLLPKESRFGVYTAYIYYFMLFEKIKGLPPSRLKEERVRIPNIQKLMLLVQSKTQTAFNLL
jgi:phytoene/squalene synthetase